MVTDNTNFKRESWYSCSVAKFTFFTSTWVTYVSTILAIDGACRLFVLCMSTSSFCFNAYAQDFWGARLSAGAVSVGGYVVSIAICALSRYVSWLFGNLWLDGCLCTSCTWSLLCNDFGHVQTVDNGRIGLFLALGCSGFRNTV